MKTLDAVLCTQTQMQVCTSCATGQLLGRCMQRLTAHLIYGPLQKLKQHNGHEDRLLLDEPERFEQPWGSSCEGEEAHLSKNHDLGQYKVLGSVA